MTDVKLCKQYNQLYRNCGEGMYRLTQLTTSTTRTNQITFHAKLITLSFKKNITKKLRIGCYEKWS